MGGKNGGTKMYCPTCKAVTTCSAVNPTKAGKKSGQRFYFIEHDDINFFRRGRECQKCYNIFVTSEVNEAFLDELVALRRNLSEIKDKAQQYQQDAEKAEKSLKDFTAKLKSLKGLQ